MCNTDKELIVTNSFRGLSSEAAPRFSAHRRQSRAPVRPAYFGRPSPSTVRTAGRRLARGAGGERREETESSNLYGEGFEAAW